VAIPPQEVSAERALMAWSDGDPIDDGPSDPTPAVVSASLRIRQIELVGFKSFRDRTLFRFPSRVTGVVGPNGCGKSNVVDAIRWVLGEQSAKRLRGDGMEDVIFGGNDRHAPLGMSQVSIVFETDGLPLDQFALLKEAGHPLTSTGPAEIMVTRRYFRSGESEYLMNGVPCRLRDVTELFLGTGLGGKAYAIIEQGRVEALIGAKPEELRLFIEEAAGTTLYRSRRQMAERKMERTRENLLRVQDILREVERQLASLRRQARRAEQYRGLQKEIAELDIAISARARLRLTHEVGDLGAQREELAAREAALTAAIDALEATRRGAREREIEAQQRVQQTQAAAYEARAAADACRSELARLEGRAQELEAQDAATAGDLEQARAERSRIQGELEDALAQLGNLTEAIDEAAKDLAVHEAGLARANEELLAETQALEAGRAALVDAVARLAEAQNAWDVLCERRSQEEARRARLEESARGLGDRERDAAEQAESAERRVAEQQARLGVLEGEKRDRAESLRSVLSERASWEHALDGMKESLARVRSRRESLREIQDSRAGYTEGVRAVLAASSRDEALALVAEILEIPAEQERAVAAVLGEHLQALVMKDQRAAKDAVQALRRAGAGRATCLPREAAEGQPTTAPPPARPLLELVRVREGYERVAQALLGGVYVVDDLETALTLWRGGEGAVTLVTPAGETLAPSGAITGGSERSEETLLAQRRELRALDGEVEQREADLIAARARNDELTETVQRREVALQEIDGELAKVAMTVVGAEKDLQRSRHETHEIQEQRRAVLRELDDVAVQLASREQEASQLEAVRQAAGESRDEGTRAVESAESRLAERREAARSLHEAQTSRRIALAEKQARCEALRNGIERLRRSDEEADRRATSLADRRRVDEITLQQTREARSAVAVRIGTLEGDVETRAEALGGAEVALGDVRAETERAEREIGEAQGAIDGARSRGSALDLQIAEQRMTLTHLEQSMREKYQCDLAGVEVRDGDTAEEESHLVRLRERISGMGEVNVGALSEIAELEERQSFLGQQRDDLERALEDLRKTIGRLNRASRTKFRETFDRVDASFREVLPKLFGGGRGQLRLTDEEQILESGVEVIVQPPGKRLGSLDLLSGGEKALTAVSLIFALFLIKPSPFCFLDEVDAPLDDANIGRFNAMVREMSTHSQFILITHNKRTMEVAETLYGITMEEPGVSKVVSVRLPD
jgi:chromosome segregation protein